MSELPQFELVSLFLLEFTHSTPGLSVRHIDRLLRDRSGDFIMFDKKTWLLIGLVLSVFIHMSIAQESGSGETEGGEEEGSTTLSILIQRRAP